MIKNNIYILACGTGEYGPDCTRQCHCEDQNKCDKVGGQCSGTACSAGWTDHPQCQTGE